MEESLDNARKIFYALSLTACDISLSIDGDMAVSRRNVSEAADETPLQLLSGTCNPDEHRIRDSFHHQGLKVLTLASILKHDLFPLTRLMQEIMDIGKVGMGCPVELEFSLNLYPDRRQTPELAILQIRPMTEVADKGRGMNKFHDIDVGLITIGRNEQRVALNHISDD